MSNPRHGNTVRILPRKGNMLKEKEPRKKWEEAEWQAFRVVAWVIIKKLIFIALVPIVWTVAVVLGVSVRTITHTLTGNHLD